MSGAAPTAGEKRGVFISYRRKDAAATAGRLEDHFRLVAPTTHVFLDVDDIAPGEDFVEAIDRAIDESGAMIVLMGALWGDQESEGARLHEEEDHVRAEVRAGLESKLLVVPVLIDGAAMPAAEDLPEDLLPLIRLNGFDLRNSRFESDANDLVRAVTGAAPLKGASVRTWIAHVSSGALAGLFALLLLGVIHNAATGRALDTLLGQGATTLMFPVFAVAGAIAAGYRLSRRSRRG